MKKLLALILSLLLLLPLLNACDNNSSPSETPSAPPSSAAAQTSSEGVNSTEEPRESDTLGLPFSDTLITYTIWNGPLSISAGMTTPNDSHTYKLMEQMSNVHIEWEQPAQGMDIEQFGLIIASGNFPDVFFGGKEYYIGGVDRYIEDGLLRDLTDLVDQYAPNYQFQRNRTDDIRRYTMTDTGRIPYFRTINVSREPTYTGGWARQDWLDVSGTGIKANDIQTYDELHDMFVVLKDFAGVAPYYLGGMSGASNGIDDFFMTGYGVNQDGFVNRNGTVVFGFTDPGYLEYLTMMKQWYDEGLIDPEFYSRAGLAGGDSAMWLNGGFGAYSFLYSIDMLEQRIPDEGVDIQGFSAPVKNKDDIRKLAYYHILPIEVGGAFATVTFNSDDVIPLIKWLDYFYSEEGALFGNWGIDGESYTIDPAGNPQWTELVYGNPDVMMVELRALYATGPIHPKLYYWQNGYSPTLAGKCVSTPIEIWDRNYQDSETMPEIFLTVDESTEYANAYSDIHTYIEEMTVKFIIGSVPLTDWDSYVNWVTRQGIDKCIKIQQAALDRFNSR